MAVMLLSSVAMRVLAADPAPQLAPDGQTHAVEGPSSPLAAQALERLSATRERPLFSPSRRPPTPPPALPSAPPPPPAPPDVALLAVVMDGEQARAIIRTGRKIMRVQIGDDIDGWKVGQIEARQLVLSLDDRTAKFAMFTGNRANSPGDAGAQPENLAQQSSAPSSEAAPPTAAYTHPKRPHRQY